MPVTISLSEYVNRVNGVPLGHKDSLKNMLSRSLGAASFPVFWHFWNPIWGYCLSRFIMRPVSRYIPNPAAVLVTFTVSGALHDLAVSLIRLDWVVFCTPWFFLMGVLVVISKALRSSYGHFSWPVRAAVNLMMVLSTLAITFAVNELIV